MNPLAILCWARVSWREWTIADISNRKRKNLAHFDYFVANSCSFWHTFTGLSNVVVCKNDKYQVWSGPKKLQEILQFTVLVGEGNRVYLESKWWMSELPALEMPFGWQFWGGKFWVRHSSELPALFIYFFCVDMTFNWFQMLFWVFCIVSVQDLYGARPYLFCF